MVSSTPRPHFTPWKDPVLILQEAGWAPGPVWTSGKSRPHRDSIPDRPARIQSLYRLSYRAHIHLQRTENYKGKERFIRTPNLKYYQDVRCTCNMTSWYIRITLTPIRLSEQPGTISPKSAVSWRCDVAGNSEKYLGLHKKCLEFLSDFKYI